MTKSGMAGTIVVSRKYLDGGKVVTEESEPVALEARAFNAPPAVVKVSVRGCKNLGNYESFHCEVGIELPCYAEEADAAYEHAISWARERVLKEIEAI